MYDNVTETATLQSATDSTLPARPTRNTNLMPDWHPKKMVAEKKSVLHIKQMKHTFFPWLCVTVAVMRLFTTQRHLWSCLHWHCPGLNTSHLSCCTSNGKSVGNVNSIHGREMQHQWVTSSARAKSVSNIKRTVTQTFTARLLPLSVGDRRSCSPWFPYGASHKNVRSRVSPSDDHAQWRYGSPALWSGLGTRRHLAWRRKCVHKPSNISFWRRHKGWWKGCIGQPYKKKHQMAFARPPTMNIYPLHLLVSCAGCNNLC